MSLCMFEWQGVAGRCPKTRGIPRVKAPGCPALIEACVAHRSNVLKSAID